jgi:hypothetical protein
VADQYSEQLILITGVLSTEKIKNRTEQKQNEIEQGPGQAVTGHTVYAT